MSYLRPLHNIEYKFDLLNLCFDVGFMHLYLYNNFEKLEYTVVLQYSLVIPEINLFYNIQTNVIK